MFTFKQIKHTASTLVLAGIGMLASLAPSQAVNLNISVWTPLPGTTLAARPELAGTVILDKMIPLKVQFTNTNGVKTIWTGQVENRIVQERKTVTGAPGHLTFYYRIFSDTTNTDSIYGITLFTQPATHSFTQDGDWRIDGLGTVAPNKAFRDASATQFYFGGSPIAPGQTSRSFFIRTNANHYALDDAGWLSGGLGTFHLYGPTP